MNLHKIHRFSAIIIVIYDFMHIVNHLFGLISIEAHIAFMEKMRLIYRFPVIEALLITAVALQIFSGFNFVVRGWKQRQGFISWVQAISGAYLIFFLLNHIAAVLVGRNIFHLDTNFFFAAAGFSVPPFQFFFAPYYFLAVLALFVHLGCVLYWQLPANSFTTRILAISLPSSLGLVISLLIVLSLSGIFYPVLVPVEYKAIYGGHV
jgi:hypothetical protein